MHIDVYRTYLHKCEKHKKCVYTYIFIVRGERGNCTYLNTLISDVSCKAGVTVYLSDVLRHALTMQNITGSRLRYVTIFGLQCQSETINSESLSLSVSLSSGKGSYTYYWLLVEVRNCMCRKAAYITQCN